MAMAGAWKITPRGSRELFHNAHAHKRSLCKVATASLYSLATHHPRRAQFMQRSPKTAGEARTTSGSTPPAMGPAIVASGYLVKRTRSLNRWKKRWWQLTDDGTLVYFKSEERTKALGEIDVARSCYEVRFGADQCKVDFPGAVPECCCFSFSVLKRTYYMYAASAAEAKCWADSISSLSVVLNYKKKMARRPAPEPPNTSLQQRPASVACVSTDRDLEGGEGGKEKRSYSMPSGGAPPRLPKVHASISGDVTYSQIPFQLPPAAEEENKESTDKHTELPRIAKQGKPHRIGRPPGNRYGSAPNIFFGTNSGANSRRNRSTPRHPRQQVNSQLWLDGSPPPNTRLVAPKNNGPPKTYVAAPRAAQQQPYSGGSLDRQHLKKKRAKAHAGQQQLITRWPVDMDGSELPPRPQSVDVSLYPQKMILTQQKRRVDAGKPTLTPVKTTSYSVGDLSSSEPKMVPPPVKPKPILKKPRAIHSPEGDQSLPTIPDADEPDNEWAAPPVIPPKLYRLKVSVNSESGQRSVFLPPPPNFKPPPPPERAGSDTSSLSLNSSTNGRVLATSTNGEANKPISAQMSRGSGQWYTDPNLFLRQVSM